MQSEAAGRAGEPSGQGEEAPPEGPGGHHPLVQTDARGPAGQVMGQHLDGQPCAVGGEAARGEMVEADAVLEVSDGILDLGVAAMVGLQFQGFPVPVGDEAVIAVAGEEGQLGTGRGLHPPDDEPHWGGFGLALEGSVGGLGHVGAAVHPVGDGRPVLLGNRLNQLPEAGVLADGDGEADIHLAADDDQGVGIEAAVGPHRELSPGPSMAHPAHGLPQEVGGASNSVGPALAQPRHQHLSGAGGDGQQQRLDSTHIMSNIATLTRLGLFCETMRLFLRALRWEHPELRPGVPEGLLGRYLKEEDEATHYEDARTGEGRRRLSVCARDLYRLVDRFHGTTAAQLEEYWLLERLLREQCHVGKHQDGRPRDDDDDAGECKVPVALKDPKQVSADSLQSPHDPDVTYSGHKGKGYEVQVAETCHEENATQLITHVEVTPSSGSDTDVSVPVVDGLAERKVRPDELFADTAYGSGRNAFEASRRGTELVSPVAGSAPGNSHEGEGDGPPPLTAADFQIDVTGEQATVCPAGHPSIEEYELKDAPERVEVHFAGTTCEPCPLRSRCPVKLDRRAGAYVLKADLVKVNIERRRRAEATEEWRKRYDIRAGIEGTNSELKRAHGLGRLRVRGGRRVRLAVYLKALACNFKRMVHARLVEMENTAQRAVGTVPAVAAA